MPSNATPSTASAETKVLAALGSHPGSTVGQIALAAGVGRSTAGKILAVAEHHRRARRTSGGSGRGGRTADRWTLAAEPATPARLGRGALRNMVAEFLTAHPGVQFGPVAIGKALGRSSGAIANALTTLTVSGQAIQTSERPVRYAAPALEGDPAATDDSTSP